jgi:hypothetical protein
MTHPLRNAITQQGELLYRDATGKIVALAPGGSGAVVSYLGGIPVPAFISGAFPSSVYTHTLTTDYTLTNASPGIINMNGNGVGQSLILPDATTMVTSSFRFIVRNGGASNALLIKDAGLTQLASLPVSILNRIAIISLVSVSTANGVWFVHFPGAGIPTP